MKKLWGILLFMFIGSAQAVPIFFNDRTAFEAAVGGTLNFESFENDFAVSDTVVFGGFTVRETNGANALAQLRNFPGVIDAAITDGTGAIGFDDNGSSIGSFFSFTDTVNAFGIDVASNQNTSITIGGSISDTLNLSANTAQFWGVIELGGITSLSFDASGGPIIGFDAAAYGQVSTVPEPTNLALLGLGLMALAFARRSKSS